MMEIQIKKAIKAGNSSAVILPRAWLNKEVRIELVKKTPEIILMDAIQIIKKHIELKDVIGIYLVGSYARGEEDEKSDIDILVITKDSDRELLTEGIYNILIISTKLLNQKLKLDLFPIGQMLKEAKPLLNSSYLDDIEINVTKENVKWYLDTTEDKLRMIKEIIDMAKSKNKKYINDRAGYTIILRIRTLYIIEKLIENKDYSKKELVKIIKYASGGTSVYEGYLAVKNDEKEGRIVRIEEAERLYEYLKKELIKVKKLLK